MDNQELQIWCANDGKRHKAELGTTLQEISKKWCTKVRDPKTGATGPVLAALVDHKLKELSYRMVVSHEIEFIGYSSSRTRSSSSTTPFRAACTANSRNPKRSSRGTIPSTTSRTRRSSS